MTDQSSVTGLVFRFEIMEECPEEDTWADQQWISFA